MSTTSFTELYGSSFARLVGQLTVVTANREAAKDVVQEAFSRCWRDWASISTYDRPEAWVRRVAINLAVSRARRLRRLLVPPPATTAGPEEEGVARADVERALRTVPIRHRQALLLHYVVGLPVVDVAQEMGAAVGSVKSWLHRGRQEMQKLLDVQEAPNG